MAILARILGYLVGPGLSVLTVPTLVLGLIVSVHKNVVGWRAAKEEKIETAATNQCNSRWLLALSKNRERAAVQRAAEAEERIEGERRINEGLNNDLERIRTEAEQLRSASASADSKCLSDGVLDALRRRQELGTGLAGGARAKSRAGQ